jgi:hypothetical protein
MLPQIGSKSQCECCNVSARKSLFQSRRGWEGAAGALSIGVWVLMPKCPLCLAAHLALWTGLGLSFTQAAYFRWALLALSGGVLIYLATKRMVSAIK